MQVTKALIGFFVVTAFYCANAEDVPQVCESPTAGQQMVLCKRVALRISTQQVTDLFNQNMTEYQGNDRNILAKAHLPAAAPEFAKAQKSWTAYKEASCKAEYNYVGSGSLREIEYLDCLLEFNKRRLEELRPHS
ncbi:lysozyme inhibitor LprI family protein [Rhodoferax lacus]|nr:lysozyme inhibitor LprI family protein [Rhodoferax lacus]